MEGPCSALPFTPEEGSTLLALNHQLHSLPSGVVQMSALGQPATGAPDHVWVAPKARHNKALNVGKSAHTTRQPTRHSSIHMYAALTDWILSARSCAICIGDCTRSMAMPLNAKNK